VRPILFELTLLGATRPIGGYGLAVALGMLLSGAFAARAASRARADVGAVIACCGYAVAGGLLGAWLAFVAVEWARTGSVEAALLGGGGLVFYGAVPGGVLAGWVGARMLGVPFLRIVDLSIPGVAAGHALGRIGCFLGGCCFGAEHHGPLSVTFTDPIAPAAHPAVPRHPVQLYESAGLLALSLAFALVPVRRTDGTRALAYVVAYGALRLATEALRGDAIRGVWGPLSTSQLVSLVLASLAALALAARFRARPGVAALGASAIC
jgi:phosphatidylglycerol---prolipoprotein diacylglyceryl transferase